MKGIPELLFDECDRALVESMGWHRHKTKHTTYARSNTRPKFYLHRLLLKAPKVMEVDHKNGNGLDCRRANLRVASKSQNMMNTKAKANNKSGRKGVHLSKDGKWRAELMANGTRYRSGGFDNFEEAVAWRLAAEKLYHGEYAGFGSGAMN